MQFRNLGNLSVPVIGMGTYISFDVSSQSDIDVRHKIIDQCIEHGVTLLDSSPMYGQAERVIGLSTEGKRDNLMFATKVWTRGKEEGERQIRQSFELMKTDYVDIFQVHNLLDWQTHLPTLERLKEEGKIGAIGVTHMYPNEYPEMMRIMKTGRIDSIQVPYNVVDRVVEAEVLPLADELNIGVIIMEPLKKGRYASGLRREPDMSPLAEFGITSWAQALLVWVVGDPRVSVAIPATSRPERVGENALAGMIGPIPQELRDYIREETERCL